MAKLTDQVSCLIQFNHFKEKNVENSLELKSQHYYQFKFSESFQFTSCLWVESDLLQHRRSTYLVDVGVGGPENYSQFLFFTSF